MSRTTYGVTRTFGETTYGCEGMSSREAALLNVYERAFNDGKGKPRQLREKWWQLWRPTKHNEIESHFVNINMKG